MTQRFVAQPKEDGTYEVACFNEITGQYEHVENCFSEEDAKAMIVRGFAYPISKELPVEYAVEMNNLIRLEMKGSIG